MHTRIARVPGEHRCYVAAAVGIIVVVLAGTTSWAELAAWVIR